MEYHYTVRKSSWGCTDEEFQAFKGWARNQKSFYWNFCGGTLELFSFWANPVVLSLYLEEKDIPAQYLSIDVMKGALPESR